MTDIPHIHGQGSYSRMVIESAKAERDRLKAANVALLAALEEVVSAHEYTTPAGTINCRFCDNSMDHEGTFEDMHDENCVISKVRAAIAKAKGPTP